VRLHPPSSILHPRWWTALASILLVFCASTISAQNPLATFDAANKLYEQGKPSEAASAYQSLIQSGHASAAVYFNLGNAFFKNGELGRAIFAFRQAQQLTPRDPDIRANLQFARNQTQGPTLTSTRWQRALGRLSLNEWTVLASSAVWLVLVLLALFQWRPALKPLLRGYAIALTIGALAVCAGLGAAVYQNRAQPVAVVITRDTVVHYGPYDESPSAFPAHDGAELNILDRKSDWLQVTPDSRRIGWLRRDQILVAPGS